MSKSRTLDWSTAVGSSDATPTNSRIPALTIISHPRSDRAGSRTLLDALAAGREVKLSRGSPDFSKPGELLGLPLSDPFVSRRPILLSAIGDDCIRLRAASESTPMVVDSQAVETMDLTPTMISRGTVIELAKRVVLLLHYFDRDVVAPRDSFGMIGDSTGIRRVRVAIDRIVDLHVPVLIRGETGTGKELVARAIHERSPHRNHPFVPVNLGALPRELAAAELFGSVKGAYTGAARDRRGLFAMAHGGTLFLDEVGEAPPEIQVMLLRALEMGEIYPVGADLPLATHVRVIAATDANLEAKIHRGTFKAPLLHRLSGYEIRIPPLRERREDVGALLFQFARDELAATQELHVLAPSEPQAKPWMPASIAAQLTRYDWPGNIRQLRNVVRQIVIENRGQAQVRVSPQLEIPPTSPPSIPHPATADGSEPGTPNSGHRRRPSDVTEVELLTVLQGCGWNLSEAADLLGIPRPSLYHLIEKSPSIRKAGDLRSEEIINCFGRLNGDLDAMVAELQVSRWGLSRRIKELGLVPGR